MQQKTISIELKKEAKKMLDKKMAVVVVLVLLSATTVLGANLIVNGSGIIATTQGAPPEVELLIGHSGSPNNILVITVANVYTFNGNIDANTITYTDRYVKFSGYDSAEAKQYSATASKTDNLNAWTLDITYEDGEVLNYNIIGHLQINSV